MIGTVHVLHEDVSKWSAAKGTSAYCDRRFSGKGLTKEVATKACACLKRVSLSQFTKNDLRQMANKGNSIEIHEKLSLIAKTAYANVLAKRECGFAILRRDLFANWDGVLRKCKEKHNPKNCECVVGALQKRMPIKIANALSRDPTIDITEGEAEQLGEQLNGVYSAVVDACAGVTRSNRNQ